MTDLNLKGQLTEQQDPYVPPDPTKITSPGATTPAAGVLSIKDQLRAQAGSPTTASGATRRPPGRPRKEPTPTTKTPEQVAAEKLAAKRQRASELKGKMVGEYNDVFLEFVVSQTPLTTRDIWLPGREPKHDNASGKYTDIGSVLAVNDFMATSLAHFAAELEYSGVGQSVTGAVSGGPIGMILWGLLSLASVGMYAKGVKDMMDRMAVLQAAAERAQQARVATREGVMQ